MAQQGKPSLRNLKCNRHCEDHSLDKHVCSKQKLCLVVSSEHCKIYFDIVETEVMENNVPFLAAEAMMTSPLLSPGAEPEFEAEPRYLTHKSANDERIWLAVVTH